jgi:hypothetical protein
MRNICLAKKLREKCEEMHNPILATLIFLVLVFGCFSAQPATNAVQGRSSLVVANGTGRDFHRLHISWSRDKDWGPNLLQNVLRPGTSFTRNDMVPAEYDLLLVDGNQNHCTLRKVPVYNNQTLRITEELLANNCRRN